MDFGDIDSFLTQLILELGCPSDQIPSEPSREELLDLSVRHLNEYSYIIVMDDVDTLEDELQQEIYNISLTVFSRTRSKSLITARRNLGAPRTQFIEINGLNISDFSDFVITNAKLMGINLSFQAESVSMKEFLAVTDGSPLFALSVLHLVSLGERFDRALQRWKGSDGEKVREAAFSREVGRLKSNEARVLLCSAYLQETSVVELASILRMSNYEVQNSIEKIKEFSMVALGSELPGGQKLIVPRSIILMTSVIERKVEEHSFIKQACKEHVEIISDVVGFASEAINRAIAFLRQEKPKDAIDTINSALAHTPENGDLFCMLGRCYVEAGPSFIGDAEDAFRTARQNSCTRRELYDYWINARKEKGDWRGVIELTIEAEVKHFGGRYAVHRALAYKELGDGFRRANSYDDAVKQYIAGCDDTKKSIGPSIGSVRTDLIKIQKDLIYGWLGVVQISMSGTGGHFRIISSCHKILCSYNQFDEKILNTLIFSLGEFISGLEQRRSLSETSYDQLGNTCRRLLEINERVSDGRKISVDSLVHLSGYIKTFNRRAEVLRRQSI